MGRPAYSLFFYLRAQITYFLLFFQADDRTHICFFTISSPFTFALPPSFFAFFDLMFSLLTLYFLHYLPRFLLLLTLLLRVQNTKTKKCKNKTKTTQKKLR